MSRGAHEKQRSRLATRTAVVSGTALAVGGVGSMFASAHAATMAAWNCIAHYESGGKWHLSYGTNDSTGGLQIETRTWDDFGGRAYASEAYQATESQQIAIAEKILAGQGPGAWTTNRFGCGLAWSGPNASYLRGGVNPLRDGLPPAVSHLTSIPLVATLQKQDTDVVPAASATHVVVHGEYLFKIALEHYGNGEDWRKIYAANVGVIGSDPNLILPGQVLRLP